VCFSKFWENEARIQKMKSGHIYFITITGREFYVPFLKLYETEANSALRDTHGAAKSLGLKCYLW
jgi:hypothetical protein